MMGGVGQGGHGRGEEDMMGGAGWGGGGGRGTEYQPLPLLPTYYSCPCSSRAFAG